MNSTRLARHLYADRNATPPEAGAVRKMVTTVFAATSSR